MLRIFTAVVATGFVLGTIGCNQSPEGGTPNSESSFRFSGPVMSSSIKQGGGPVAIDLKLKPEEQFTETVAFSASSVEGLTIEFKPGEVKPADPKDVKMMVSAAKDAPLGNKRITVTAKPSSGKAVTIDVSVSVQAGADDKKDEKKGGEKKTGEE